MTETLCLPSMGCGTWAWGNRLLWGYQPSMDQELQQVFNLCLDHGVTLFDTGDSYGTGKFKGRSESLLGKFAAAQNNLCIATKLAPYPWRLTRQSMVEAAQASAARLGRNIDLVQMHWSTANYAPWQERPLLDGLGDLYERGLVRGIGLSNYGPIRLRRAHQQFAERGLAIATLQVQYSLLSTYPVTELGLKDLCDQLGIKIIAYSPLALGLLTGKYRSTDELPSGIRGFLFRQILPGMKSLLECMEEVAQSRQKTLSQIALNWCIAKGTIPIPGAKSQKQAQENLGALGWQLSQSEVEALDQAATKVKGKMVQNIFQTR
ncbi:aldo/keto reductase [Gloeocapsa sp. PCC 73106]|uniref:aldo/keto reductase n=1 Tax=Gloeocapsa sp. PCC 73106 TaxID=102232 RepID=UPI0002AC8111|nr:aldo/keto reductase [Gloeocapsa sp. PCC 73106]ELR97108.1 putative oxidoreductase, aryl-alcohol dehydrogenase like protein [Gloeocapsa sp. PCC 73106]